MHHNALADFLLPWVIPAGSDEYQIAIRMGFASLIFGLTLLTTLLFLVNARESSWQRNWQGVARYGRVSPQLDIDHGSVNDISLAIRTRSEALASNVPGVLLVIGLLGTFVGLGLALSEASLALTAITGSTSPASAGSTTEMSAALGNMMRGLGYKFATSTWGIIGYLLLRGAAALHGFEDRRLRFAASMMREQLDAARRVRQSASRADQARFADLIKQVLDEVTGTAASTRHMAKTGADTLAVLNEFLGGVQDNIKQMGASSKSMAQSAERVDKSAGQLGASATALQGTVNNFDVGVRNTLDEVKEGLSQAIADLSSTTTKSMDRIAHDLQAVTTTLSDTLKSIQGELTTTLKTIDQRTAESNSLIAESLQGLSKSVNEVLAKLGAAMDKATEANQNASKHFAASATRLLELSRATQEMVNSIQKDIVGALSSVAEGNFEIRKIFGSFEAIAKRSESATNALITALEALREPPPPASVPASDGHAVRPSRLARRNAPK